MFSFIIPTYNRGDVIGRTLDSFLSQQYSKFEIIVVDDGSTDNTAEIIAAYRDSRISYIKIPNSERGFARNKGLTMASGKYINYFDSDDIFLASLSSLQKIAEGRGWPDVFYGQIESRAGWNISAPPFESFKENLLHNNFLACGSVFLNREVALKYPFNPDRRLSSAEDWELWLRVSARFNFQNIDTVLFRQPTHEGRSLNTITPERIEIRDTYFAELVAGNNDIVSFYGRESIKLFCADRFTFIALNQIQHDKKLAWSYWRKALVTSRRVIGRKRFWAVLKNLVIA